MLELRGVSKRFGGVVATDEVTLDVARGEVHALIGPNGAGKTTLIGQISGVLATRLQLGLLDEPMAGMGPQESSRMIALIEKIRAEVTVLLVEHDMDAVFRLADRISVLVSGRLIATGAPQAIRADPAVRKAYLGEELAA